MKPTFKTTALAILVSLGATACLSNSSHDNVQATPVQPAKATKPAEPVETAKFDFKKEATLANGKEWRHYDFSDGTYLRDGIYRSSLISYGAGVLNFNKLSKYSTGEFVGVTNDDTYVLNKTVAKNGVHYHFINQPYSTYGFISDGEGSIGIDKENSIFYIIQQDSIAGNPVVDGVYSGNVIAQIINSDLKYIVKNDGKVTLNVKTNPDADNKLMLSGSVNSDTVGEIKLLPTEVKFEHASGSVVLQDIAGDYEAHFSNDRKDVVGTLFIHNIDEKTNNLKVNIEGKDSPIWRYNAAFGGQRQ